MGKSNLLILSLIGFLVEEKKRRKKKWKSIAISFELVVNGIHKGLCRRELEERTCLFFFFWENNDMSFRAEFHCDVRPGAERGSPPLDGRFAVPRPSPGVDCENLRKSGSPAGID